MKQPESPAADHCKTQLERSVVSSRSPFLVVADFGCGDCKIARSVKNKVHSFDLVATCELVTVCDMASVSAAYPRVGFA